MMSHFPTHASLWWRSSIRIEGTRLVPVPPFVPYNPFDSYFPIETATREQRSLPYLLLDVDYEDIQAVARFCERFGVLGNFQNVGWAQWAAESGLVYPLLATGPSPQHAKEVATAGESLSGKCRGTTESDALYADDTGRLPPRPVGPGGSDRVSPTRERSAAREPAGPGRRRGREPPVAEGDPPARLVRHGLTVCR